MLGFKALTLAPFDRRLLDVDLLTAGELHWLNQYHQRVMHEIGPLLVESDRAWLTQATAPIAG